jgi:hypothetical protein
MPIRVLPETEVLNRGTLRLQQLSLIDLGGSISGSDCQAVLERIVDIGVKKMLSEVGKEGLDVVQSLGPVLFRRSGSEIAAISGTKERWLLMRI